MASAALSATSACGIFDGEGRPVASALDQRVIGVTFEQLGRIDRCVGVAGGPRKYEAIRAALLGRWVNVLITDHVTAERLIADRPIPTPAAAADPSGSRA